MSQTRHDIAENDPELDVKIDRLLAFQAVGQLDLPGANINLRFSAQFDMVRTGMHANLLTYTQGSPVPGAAWRASGWHRHASRNA